MIVFALFFQLLAQNRLERQQSYKKSIKKKIFTQTKFLTLIEPFNSYKVFLVKKALLRVKMSVN